MRGLPQFDYAPQSESPHGQGEVNYGFGGTRDVPGSGNMLRNKSLASH